MSQIKILPRLQAKSASTQDEALIPELSVVIPTFKERGNIEVLVRRLDEALSGIAWEAISSTTIFLTGRPMR
jgi:dolichol-phosphate mannosyltransferase